MKLLVIDIQKGITDSRLFNFDEFIDNTSRIIQAARDNQIEVIYFQHDDGPGTGFSIGDEEFEIAEQVHPREGEKIFTKNINSCFGNKDFTDYVKDENTLMIVGLQTNFCIDATVKSAFERGYKVIVPQGANSTFDNDYMSGEETYKYYNDMMWPKRFATCVSVDEAIKLMPVSYTHLSDKVNASDTAWGLGVGEKKILWYSPFVPYLLDQEPLEFKMFMDRRRLTPGEWIKRHPILTVGCIAFIVWIGFRGYKFGKAQIFIYTHDGRNLKTEWTARDAVTDEQTNTAVEAAGMEREELEKWLKQSFYPYFYVNSTSFGEFDAFDVENYADVMGEDKVEAIRENISDYWGIHDRKSLMKTTDSLLQKGDKYTYAQTLEKLGEEALTLPEDSIYYTYKLYAPDEMCKYLGTYYAYNNIGDAGVDAWDYCRCIRLFAFGYICGYISYDEYLIHAAPLAVYLQNEYDSWETMYESYYCGYLIFAGRNKNSSSSVIYSDYRYYEIMADKTEIPFRTEER